MKPRVGILTTFTGADAAYSLVNVVRVQLQMLIDGGYAPVLFVAPSFQGEGVFSPQIVDVRKVAMPDAPAEEVEAALSPLLDDVDVLLCHDIVFLRQHERWARAVKRIAQARPGIAWLHWQHSRGDGVVEARSPDWWYCYPNEGDLEHVAQINSTAVERVRYVPHPLDFDYLGWPALAVRIAEDFGFPFADVSGILPARLDRQKQVEKAVRVFAGLKRAGATVCFLIADAYATGKRFREYKHEVEEIAREQGLGVGEFAFLGENVSECRIATPRPTVKALFEMSNLFIQPSNAETSSLVVMEAALAGNLVMINADFPPIHHLYRSALALPFGSILEPDVKYYRHVATADGSEVKIEDEQAFWDDAARNTILPVLHGQIAQRVKRQQLRERWPSRVFGQHLEPLILEAWKEKGRATALDLSAGDPEVTAIVCTLDNLPMLKRQVPVLLREVGQVIVVNNGSRDGTRELLEANPHPAVTAIHRENLGAGPGRNAGLDAWAGSTPYALMLDGGILPPDGGVAAMKAWLEAHPEVDVISPEVAGCFTTDEGQAHRRLDEIGPTFPQRCLSSTAYALCRARAWDGLRFSEEGPFGRPGWGVDDNEMQCRWNDAGVVHLDFIGAKLYRRASGSFARIFEETGVAANQYGSVYEQRNVMLAQTYPQYYDPTWHCNTIEVSCVVLGWNEYPMFARAIKRLHEELRDVPHEIIFIDNGSTDETKWWLDTFALRWPWGDTAIDAGTGEILRRKERPDLEPVWTGDVVRVDLPENAGTGRGYNAGFEAARGKYIFYLSGDILPVAGSVAALKRYLDEHDDSDVAYIGVNPWVCQDEDEEPPFEGFDGLPRQGLGNFAGSYAMFRREVWDAGCKLADEGPFAGPGCGYEEAEFANQMYAEGFRCFVFNYPAYYHQRRDFARSGHPEGQAEARLEERRRWLRTRWPGQRFDITHHGRQPPERRVRSVAVICKHYPDRPGISGHFLTALRGICEAERFNPGEEPEGYDFYFYVDNGDHDFFPCPEHCHPSAFWCCDMVAPAGQRQPWMAPLEHYLKRAETFDWMYAASRSSVAYFKEHGVEAELLPFCAAPDYHRPHDEEKVYDWVAIWHNCGERIEYARQAAMAFDGFVGYKDGEYYAQWLSKGRCALNLSRAGETTLRVFEVMAVGVPLVADRVNDLDFHFKEGVHYLGFDDANEMIDQIAWVLERPGEAQIMAQQARSEVLRKHTFCHRVLQVFGGGERD